MSESIEVVFDNKTQTLCIADELDEDEDEGLCEHDRETCNDCILGDRAVWTDDFEYYIAVCKFDLPNLFFEANRNFEPDEWRACAENKVFRYLTDPYDNDALIIVAPYAYFARTFELGPFASSEY